MAKKTTKSDEAQARSSTGQFIKEIRRNTAKVYTVCLQTKVHH